MEEQKGKGAWVGGCLSCVAVVLVGAIVFPVFASSGRGPRNQCLSHLKQQYYGAVVYAADVDQHLPLGEGWMDVLYPYIKTEEQYDCPAAGRYGYAMNEKLAGQSLTKWSEDELNEIPLFFDSATIGRSVTGPVSLAPDPPRHGKNNFAAYAGGRGRILVPNGGKN
jgi:hypothetical protein